jgi:hypothetical protein
MDASRHFLLSAPQFLAQRIPAVASVACTKVTNATYNSSDWRSTCHPHEAATSDSESDHSEDDHAVQPDVTYNANSSLRQPAYAPLRLTWPHPALVSLLQRQALSLNVLLTHHEGHVQKGHEHLNDVALTPFLSSPQLRLSAQQYLQAVASSAAGDASVQQLVRAPARMLISPSVTGKSLDEQAVTFLPQPSIVVGFQVPPPKLSPSSQQLLVFRFELCRSW